MRRFARIPFTTRRPVTLPGGSVGMPVPYLVDPSLRCTPLDPADPGARGEREQRLILDSPTSLLETFVPAAYDIREGDMFLVGGQSYQVRAVGSWRWRHAAFLSLLLEHVDVVGGNRALMRLGAMIAPPTYATRHTQ